MGINIWHHTKKISKHVARKTGHLFFPWIMHFLTDKYGNKHHHVIVDTILSVTMIILIASNVALGYWFYIFLTPVELNLQITVPEYVISGSEITYNIAYQNNTKNISNVDFELIAPHGYTGTTNYSMADFKKHDTGYVTMKGDIVGNVNDLQQVAVIVYYQYHGVNFSSFASQTYKINDTSFETTVNLPKEILNSQQFDWSVHYKNNSPIARKDVSLAINFPASLDITQAPENYSADEKKVILSEVAPWQEGDLSFQGIFTQALGEIESLITIKTNFDSYGQSQIAGSIDVLTPRLSISSNLPSTANMGDTFYYQINCQNIGDADLTNVTVTVDTGGLSAAGLYFTPANGILNIDYLAAGQTKSVYLTITAPAELRKENLSASVSANAFAYITDLNVKTYAASDTSATIKFNSTLAFYAEAKYYGPSNEQLGYGPYPLKANELTSLRIFWNVRDITNDLNNVTLVATLPSQVQWTGSSAVSQGADISYNPAIRQVVWHTPYIPAFSGPQGASFEVLMTPNFQQVNKQINIINDTKFTAEDSYTHTVLTQYIGPARSLVQ